MVSEIGESICGRHIWRPYNLHSVNLRATTGNIVNLTNHIMDTCSYMNKFFYSECYRVTAKVNRHLGKNTTDGIFSITRNMDVALMRPKWIFDKPMSLCTRNTNLEIYEHVSII